MDRYQNVLSKYVVFELVQGDRRVSSLGVVQQRVHENRARHTVDAAIDSIFGLGGVLSVVPVEDAAIFGD